VTESRTGRNADQAVGAGEETGAVPAAGKKRSKSMHEGVAVWHDCCSCEAEPYWQDLAVATDDASGHGVIASSYPSR